MKYWKAGIIFVAAFLIQASFLNIFNIAGYTPNLLLCLVVVFSFLYENEPYGIVFGAVFGLLYDIAYCNVIGPTAISLLAAALVVRILGNQANIENIINLWISALASIAAYYFVNWGVIHLTGNIQSILYMIRVFPWTGLYSLAVITVLYLIMINRVVNYRGDRNFR